MKHLVRVTWLSVVLVACGAAPDSDPGGDESVDEDTDTTEAALGQCGCTPGVTPADMTCLFQCLYCEPVNSSSCGAWGRAPRDGGCDAGAHGGWQVVDGAWQECTSQPPPPNPCGCDADLSCWFRCLAG